MNSPNILLQQLSEVADEKLLATNQELETKNQELLATNQELETKNQELLATNQKLQMSDCMMSTQVAPRSELNRLKDDFLSIVSHELRSPLLNMKMAIHMLKTTTSTNYRETYLEILQSECKREIALINNLLDLQQLEAGSYTQMQVGVVHLNEWLPSLIEPIRCRTQQLKQTLQVNLPSLPPLLTDSVSLGRILRELLHNACQFTPKGGKISLSISYDKKLFTKDLQPKYSVSIGSSGVSVAPRLDSECDIGVTTFTIRNSAEIPATELPWLFEKFYRSPQSHRWQQGSAGLGLALVQKLVEHLRGIVQVESSWGWTTFTVELADLQA